MPFYSRRKELDALTEREAAGELFWTSTFDQTVRTKIEYAFKDACPTLRGSQDAMAQRAESLILRDEGLRYLPGTDNQPADVFGYLACCPDDMVPTVVEAMLAAFAPRLPDNSDAPSMALANRRLQLATKSILTQHRISFELDGNQMVPFSSREMHVAVVTPTLTLLAGNMQFEQVEVAYQNALKEISNGQPSDAITDAGTALQIMLKALGAEGSSLGPLIKSANSKKLLSPHDGPLLDGLTKLLHWVSADRSQNGDSHHLSAVSIEDAWLTVHIVGALILRLSADKPRAE